MVRLPSGVRYWTVLDEDLAVVPVADSFLRQVRFGRGGAESTAKAYAGGIALWAASHFPDSFICVISCCELPVQVLVVGFLRSPVTECRVETLAIIADLDVPGNVLPCFLSRRVRGPVHPLDLHRRVK